MLVCKNKYINNWRANEASFIVTGDDQSRFYTFLNVSNPFRTGVLPESYKG